LNFLNKLGVISFDDVTDECRNVSDYPGPVEPKFFEVVNTDVRKIPLLNVRVFVEKTVGDKAIKMNKFERNK
jgi:hypothetical protein